MEKGKALTMLSAEVSDMHKIEVCDSDFFMIDVLAKGGRSSRESVIHEALLEKVEREERVAVLEAIKQADNGETVSHVEMLAYIESLNK